MAIFGLILASLGTLSTTAESLGTNGQLSAIALGKSESLLAFSLDSLKNDFSKNIATTTTEDIFSKIMEVQELDNFTKKIKSIVKWFQNGREQSVTLSEIVTNPNEAYGIGDCQLDGTESWQSPNLLSTHIDLGFGNQATGVFARGGIIYLATNNVSPRDPAADKNDFFIIDARNSSNPVILSRLDTGPGLSAIAVAGPYAYLGNTSINAQLQIADISDLYQPRIIASYKLPGNYSDGTTIPNTLFYNRHKIYLGTAKSQIEELHIINVENPALPLEVGKWETNAGINNIFVSGNYAYLATPNNEELSVLYISTSSIPQKIGGFDAPGGSGNGKSLARDRQTLFLGRTVGHNELFALNIENPAAILVRSSMAVSESINAMVASTGRLFLTTNTKFEVINTENSGLSLIGTVTLPAKPTGITCNGKSLYLSILSSDGLKIIIPSI